MTPASAAGRLRIAAAGDIHCGEANRSSIVAAFAALEGEADLVLLAGDLTSHGAAEEARVLCEATTGLSAPVFAVLGNHDCHGDEAAEIAATLREAGITVLERSAAVCRIGELEVGVAGVKGFVGGFAPSHLPDFGEPSLRRIYAETGAEVDALDAALRKIATCPIRIALLHYAPIETTLEGEPREIFAFLGSDRLAAPILEHGPDLVVHGHAHEGAAEGRIGETPVHNVSQPGLAHDFLRLELDAREAHSPIR